MNFKIVFRYVAAGLFAFTGCQSEVANPKAPPATDVPPSRIETATGGSGGSAARTNAQGISKAVTELKKEYDAFKKTASPTVDGKLSPEIEDMTQRMIDLAVNNPKSEGAFEALEFVTNIHSIGPKLFQAFGELQKNHLQNEAIGDICLKQSFNCGPGIEDLMVAVELNATDRVVLAKTIYARSRLYYFSKVNQRQFKQGGKAIEEMKKVMPTETLDYIMNFQPKDDEARALLHTLIEDYADIKIDGQSMKDVANDALKFLDEEVQE